MHFAPQLSEKLFQVLSRIPGAPRITQIAFGKILTSLLQTEAFVTFDTIVQGLYQELSGQDITYDRFLQVLVERLTDPKNLFIATLLGAISAATTPKVGPQGIVPPGEPGASAPAAKPTTAPARPARSIAPARPTVIETRGQATARQFAPQPAPVVEPEPPAPSLRVVSQSEPVPKDLPANTPVGQKPLPGVATAAASKQKGQPCRSEPCERPLPISWPVELPPPAISPRSLIRTSAADREWEGIDRGVAQRRMRDEIQRARNRLVPPPNPCFEDDAEPNAPYDAHHAHPLYLGGEDAEYNLCALRADRHQRGHPRLDNQFAHLAEYQECGICSAFLSRHPVGQTYRIVGEK